MFKVTILQTQKIKDKQRVVNAWASQVRQFPAGKRIRDVSRRIEQLSIKRSERISIGRKK